MSSRSISGTIPGSLGLLRSLRSLDLSSNPGIRGTIPESIGDLPSLVTLRLRGGGLTGQLPASLRARAAAAAKGEALPIDAQLDSNDIADCALLDDATVRLYPARSKRGKQATRGPCLLCAKL